MFVLYAIKPVAGVAIANICASVILGIKNPCVVLSACNTALASTDVVLKCPPPDDDSKALWLVAPVTVGLW